MRITKEIEPFEKSWKPAFSLYSRSESRDILYRESIKFNWKSFSRLRSYISHIKISSFDVVHSKIHNITAFKVSKRLFIKSRHVLPLRRIEKRKRSKNRHAKRRIHKH